ncbi:hypothetical protein JTB14_014251 [Gonioctena quinquepunctata]|nr:hypothetical protein JTB14_014251 [Gonioctena quinquepunctata]
MVSFCFRNKFYVFSAFSDNRKGQKCIRVIGATKTRGPEKVWCRLWYKGNEFNSSSHVSVTVAAKIKVRNQKIITLFQSSIVDGFDGVYYGCEVNSDWEPSL